MNHRLTFKSKARLLIEQDHINRLTKRLKEAFPDKYISKVRKIENGVKIDGPDIRIAWNDKTILYVIYAYHGRKLTIVEETFFRMKSPNVRIFKHFLDKI